MSEQESPTGIESEFPTAEDTPEPTSPAAEEAPLDEDKILTMLQKYIALYNQGDYIHATAHLSSSVEAECGGPTNVAFSLSQNHAIERIDYDVTAVKAWGPDDPTMADVRTVERYDGQSYRQTLGLAFVFERNAWKLDDLYPLGAGAFC